MEPDHETDDAMYARSPNSDVFGKLDAEIPPIRINSDVLVEIHRLASAAHMNLSEYVRTVLHVRAYGIDHVLSVQADRLRRAVGNAEQLHSGVQA